MISSSGLTSFTPAFHRYVLYKIPKQKHSEIPIVQSGYAYAYLDSSDFQFHLSKNSIGSKESAAGRTLNQVYNNKRNSEKQDEDIAHVFYNDENPNGRL